MVTMPSSPPSTGPAAAARARGVTGRTSRPGLSVTEIAVASLPSSTRRVLGPVDRLLVHRTSLVTRFRRVTSREGLLLHGPAGWGEASPFWDYDARESSTWLRAALESATRTPPAPVRDSVDVNVTIPVCAPSAAAALVRESGGCRTAKVKVADPGQPLDADLERVAAVADALLVTAGRDAARLRVDANGAWTSAQAIDAVRQLDRAAGAVGGLEYVEQPCPSVGELAAVRRAVDVPVAADESIRRAADPLAVARAGAADVAVVKVAPLGGISRTLAIAARTGLRVVVSSAVETSVGLAQGVLAAACLPDLPHACGLGTARLLAGDITTRPLAPRGGRLPVRAVAPDPDVLRVAPPVGETVEARWRARLDAMCAQIAELDALPGVTA